MEITIDDLIIRFRELQQNAMKRGYTQNGGYNRGVSDCIRVLLELGEDCGCNDGCGCDG